MYEHECLGVLLMDDLGEVVDLLIVHHCKQYGPLTSGEYAHSADQRSSMVKFGDDALSDGFVVLADDVGCLGVLGAEVHDDKVDHLT